jgi:hypothetical protein
VQEIADFEKNWESNSQNLKPSAKHRRKNNTMGKTNIQTKPKP